MEVTSRHTVRLLVSLAFPSPRGGWGAAASQIPRPPQPWPGVPSKPFPSPPLLTVGRRLWLKLTRSQAGLGTEDSDDELATTLHPVPVSFCQPQTPESCAGK